MSFRLHATESVSAGIRRIALDQIERAMGEVGDEGLGIDEKVHQVRKRCKKLRGLVRLVRPALGDQYDHANATFRDAARRISQARDAKVLVATYDVLMDRYADQVQRRAFGSVRRELTFRLNAIDSASLSQHLSDLRDVFERARAESQDWRLDEGGFAAIRGGLCKTHRRAVKRLEDARKQRTSEDFHQLRKRIKYLSFHFRLLRDIWPSATQPLIKAAKSIEDTLGDDHDLAVLETVVSKSPKAFGRKKDIEAFRGLIHSRQRRLQRKAITEAQLLLAESTNALLDRFSAYWQLWRDQ